jgi:hypothetical protein
MEAAGIEAAKDSRRAPASRRQLSATTGVADAPIARTEFLSQQRGEYRGLNGTVSLLCVVHEEPGRQGGRGQEDGVRSCAATGAEIGGSRRSRAVHQGSRQTASGGDRSALVSNDGVADRKVSATPPFSCASALLRLKSDVLHSKT